MAVIVYMLAWIAD